MFLTGVSYGFSPMGLYLGTNSPTYLLFVLAVAFGAILVFTEPAILILLKQIEEVTNGIIKSKYILIAISTSVIISLIISMLRLLFEVNILWFIVPITVLIFIFSYFTPPIFFSIAFDSGGIVSGTMLVAFVLPFFIGSSNMLHGNSANAFGTIGIVTLLPILAIEILGMIYNKSSKKKEKKDEIMPSSDFKKEWRRTFRVF